MTEYEILRLIWWALLGILLIGFAVMDGFDLGTAALAALRGAHRQRAARRDQHGRTGVGRQPGLVHPRRRRDLCGVAGALCRELFRLLSGDVPGAGDADLAAGRIQISQQDGIARAGAPSGTGRCSPGGIVPALVFGVAFGNLFEGVPFGFDSDLRMHSTITLFSLLNPFALLVGLVSLSMIVLHGAVWLNLKTGGTVKRARPHRHAVCGTRLCDVVCGRWGVAVEPAWVRDRRAVVA